MGDLPLAKWYLEVKDRMGRRNFISPLDTYGKLMDRNAEIREEHERNIFPIGRRDKRQEYRKTAPMIIARSEGLHGEMGWIYPGSSSAKTCCYPEEVLKRKLTYVSLVIRGQNLQRLGKKVEFGSSMGSYLGRKKVEGRDGRRRYSGMVDWGIGGDLGEMIYMPGLSKKTCIRGMADFETHRSNIMGISAPHDQRKGEKCGRRELSE